MRIITATLLMGMVRIALFASEPICTPKGAFGQTFGAKTIVGKITLKQLNGVDFIPTMAYPPFREFEAGLTQKSGKVWSVTGVAYFTSAEAALAYRDQLIASLYKDLKITEKTIDPLGQIELYTGSKGYDKTIGGVRRFYHSDGLVIRISNYTEPTNLYVEFADLELEQLQVSEALRN